MTTAFIQYPPADWHSPITLPGSACRCIGFGKYNESMISGAFTNLPLPAFLFGKAGIKAEQTMPDHYALTCDVAPPPASLKCSSRHTSHTTAGYRPGGNLRITKPIHKKTGPKKKPKYVKNDISPRTAKITEETALPLDTKRPPSVRCRLKNRWGASGSAQLFFTADAAGIVGGPAEKWQERFFHSYVYDGRRLTGGRISPSEAGRKPYYIMNTPMAVIDVIPSTGNCGGRV